MYSLRMSFWTVPGDLRPRHALLLGDGDVQRQQRWPAVALIVIDVQTLVRAGCRRRAPPCRRGWDRDADAAHLPLRLGRVGVVAHLGRQVERDRQPGLALLEQVAEARVRLLGGREAGVLAHRPEAAAVHGRLDATRERRLARPAKVAILVEVGGVGRRVQVVDLDARGGLEALAPLGARRRPPSGGWSPASGRGRDRRSGGSLARSSACDAGDQPTRSRAAGRRPRSLAPGPTATRSMRRRRAAPGPRSASSSPRRPAAAGRPSTASPGATGHGDHDAGDDGTDLGGSALTAPPRARGGPARAARPGRPARSRPRSASRR